MAENARQSANWVGSSLGTKHDADNSHLSQGDQCAERLIESGRRGARFCTTARERARSSLGSRYDIMDFHEAGLNCGRVPLDILSEVIDRYIKEKMTA